MKSLHRRLATIGSLALALAAALLALPAAAATTVQEAPSSNLPFLFGVFAVAWLAFFLYAFYTSRKQFEVERAVYELRQALERHLAGKP